MAERARLASATQDAAIARTGPHTSEATPWTLDSLRGRSLPEPETMVYVLAYARARPFYINVASKACPGSLMNAYAHRNGIYRLQKRRYGQERETPLYLVYFECHASYDAAVARCTHIWAMPHVWQRSMIERFNGEWLNVIDELIAVPCSTHAIGEEGLVPLDAQEHAAVPR